MNKIDLTEEEKRVLQKYVNGEFQDFGTSAEEKKIFGDVVAKAHVLMKELNAYDELENYPAMSVLLWFNDKLNK